MRCFACVLCVHFYNSLQWLLIAEICRREIVQGPKSGSRANGKDTRSLLIQWEWRGQLLGSSRWQLSIRAARFVRLQDDCAPARNSRIVSNRSSTRWNIFPSKNTRFSYWEKCRNAIDTANTVRANLLECLHL